ncbi:MAG: hypothetical protein B7Z37_23840 [Verrucomicrobia bacterium 12-59-8]|nr:MAG: hypothetical protein B7Z37_23840 [Verrucomicrobia bacterium 12-59-8]
MKSLMVPLACLAFTTAAIADPLARQYAAEIVRQNVKVPDTEAAYDEQFAKPETTSRAESHRSETIAAD